MLSVVIMQNVHWHRNFAGFNHNTANAWKCVCFAEMKVPNSLNVWWEASDMRYAICETVTIWCRAQCSSPMQRAQLWMSGPIFHSFTHIVFKMHQDLSVSHNYIRFFYRYRDRSKHSRKARKKGRKKHSLHSRYAFIALERSSICVSASICFYLI